LPKKRSKKSKRAYRGDPRFQGLKRAYVSTQLEIMKRSLRSVDFEFTLKTTEGILKYIEDLGHLLLQKKLDSKEHASLQHGASNAIRILIPQQPMQVIQAVQTTVVPSQPDISKLLDELPLELREQVLERWKNEIFRKLESNGSGGGSGGSQAEPAIPGEIAVSTDGVEQLASQANGSNGKDRGESSPPPT